MLIKKCALINECILDPPISNVPLAHAKIKQQIVLNFTAGATRWVVEPTDGLVSRSENYSKQLDHTCKYMHLLFDANLRKAACAY